MRAAQRIVRRHRDADVQLGFEDGEVVKRSLRWSDRRPNRVGQKGRNAHVWYQKGLRPVAPTDKQFKSIYIYGAVRPGTDDAFGLALPRADTAMMSLFLHAFSATLPPKVHAVLVMDKAGWHVTGRVFFDRGLVDAASALAALTGEPASAEALDHLHDGRP